MTNNELDFPDGQRPAMVRPIDHAVEEGAWESVCDFFDGDPDWVYPNGVHLYAVPEAAAMALGERLEKSGGMRAALGISNRELESWVFLGEVASGLAAIEIWRMFADKARSEKERSDLDMEVCQANRGEKGRCGL